MTALPLAVFIRARDTVYVSSAHVSAGIDLRWDLEEIPLMNDNGCNCVPRCEKLLIRQREIPFLIYLERLTA